MGLFGPNKIERARREKVLDSLRRLFDGDDVQDATSLGRHVTPRYPKLSSGAFTIELYGLDSSPIPMFDAVVITSAGAEPDEGEVLAIVKDVYQAVLEGRKGCSIRKREVAPMAWDVYEVLQNGQPRAGLYRRNMAMLGMPNP